MDKEFFNCFAKFLVQIHKSNDFFQFPILLRVPETRVTIPPLVTARELFHVYFKKRRESSTLELMCG